MAGVSQVGGVTIYTQANPFVRWRTADFHRVRRLFLAALPPTKK